MKQTLFLLLLICIKAKAQKEARPQFYDSTFKMPADAPLRTDGFYLIRTIHYDTLPMSNVKKNGFINLEEEYKTLYRFYDNGYFFFTSVGSGITNLTERLQNDSAWVRKLYKMKLTDAWGFYKLTNDSVIIETFRFEDNLQDIMKTFSKQYFVREEFSYRIENKMLVITNRIVKGTGKEKFVALPPEFIPSAFYVDPSQNKLFTFGRFRRKTGFNQSPN